MSATAIPQEKSETRTSVKISWNGIRKSFLSPLLVTVFAAIFSGDLPDAVSIHDLHFFGILHSGIHSGSADLAGKESYLYLSWTGHEDIHVKK